MNVNNPTNWTYAPKEAQQEMQALADQAIARRRLQPVTALTVGAQRSRSAAVIGAELGAVLAAIDPAAEYSDDPAVIAASRKLQSRADSLRAELRCVEHHDATAAAASASLDAIDAALASLKRSRADIEAALRAYLETQQ